MTCVRSWPKAHPDAPPAHLSPIFCSERQLSYQGAGNRLPYLKDSRRAVAGMLGDAVAAGLDLLLEDGIVTSQDRAHLRRVALPQPS